MQDALKIARLCALIAIMAVVTLLQGAALAGFFAGKAAGEFYFAHRSEFARVGRVLKAAAIFAAKVTLIGLELAFVLACHAAREIFLHTQEFAHAQMGDLAWKRGEFTAYQTAEAVEAETTAAPVAVVSDEAEAYASAPAYQATVLVGQVGYASYLTVLEAGDAASDRFATVTTAVYVNGTLAANFVVTKAKEWAQKAREIAAVVTK